MKITIEIFFQIVSMNIEEKYDVLTVYDGSKKSSTPVLAQLSGSSQHITLTSTASFVTFHFSSDHSVQGKGFNISWRAGLFLFYHII